MTPDRLYARLRTYVSDTVRAILELCNWFTIVVYLFSALLWGGLWFWWVYLPLPCTYYILVVPWVVFGASTIWCFLSEGFTKLNIVHAEELEKLKFIDDTAGRLVTLLALFVAIPWLNKESYTPTDAFVKIVLIIAMMLLGILLPMFWSRPSGHDQERISLHKLRILKTAAYSHCLGWTTVGVVLALKSLVQ